MLISSSVNTIPTSVVLEMMIFISGLWAHSKISSHCSFGRNTRLIEELMIASSDHFAILNSFIHITYIIHPVYQMHRALPCDVDLTTTIRPLNIPWRFALSIK